MSLLSLLKFTENEDDSTLANTDIKNAVVFSAHVLKEHRKLLPQYGLLGEAFSTGGGDVADPRLFLNTNHPFSVFLCGLQGAGKSHSLSCLLGETPC
jgi:signal recognition particle GTPase